MLSGPTALNGVMEIDGLLQPFAAALGKFSGFDFRCQRRQFLFLLTQTGVTALLLLPCSPRIAQCGLLRSREARR